MQSSKEAGIAISRLDGIDIEGQFVSVAIARSNKEHVLGK
jgi:hypothetical protein